MHRPIPLSLLSLRRAFLACLHWVSQQFGGGPDLRDPLYARELTKRLRFRLQLLYAVIVTTTTISAIAYQGTGPFFFNSIMPALVVSVCLWRAAYWSDANTRSRSERRLASDLERMPLLGLLIGLMTAFWGLTTYSSGDPNQQSLSHFAVAVTTLVTILALGLIPKAAISAAISSVVPSSVIFLKEGHPNSVEVVITLTALCFLVLRISLLQRTDFHSLFNSMIDLERRAVSLDELAEELKEYAFVDLLTGVPNRRAILSDLASSLQDETAESPWLAILDLDGFKRINDLYGHTEGDLVLVEVCRRLGKRQRDLSFGRLGGDEFVILLDGSFDEPYVVAILTDLLASISQPIKSELRSYKVTASIGLRKTERLSMGECLERADAALYQAKEEPGRLVIFSQSSEDQFLAEKIAAEAVRNSDFSETLQVMFQPIIDFDSKQPLALEALARWSEAPTHGIDTAKFIELVESSGRISEISDIVVQKAFAAIAHFPDPVSIQINLSAWDLQSDHLLDKIETIARKHRTPRRRITFEVTETALIGDFSKAVEVVASLRHRGFRVALDDFGTGYSSLAYINRLPLDQIKIDREFANSLLKNGKSMAIVSAIWALSQQLGISCTIEGIETSDQALRARQVGLRRMQGYLFSEPLSLTDALEYVNNSGLRTKGSPEPARKGAMRGNALGEHKLYQ